MTSATVTANAAFIAAILLYSFGCVVAPWESFPKLLCKENKMGPLVGQATAAQLEHQQSSCVTSSKFFTKTLPVDVPDMPNAKPVAVTYMIECCDISTDSRVVQCAAPAGILNPDETTVTLAHHHPGHLRVGLRLYSIDCPPMGKAELQPFAKFPLKSLDKDTTIGFCLTKIEAEEAKLGAGAKPPPGLAETVYKFPLTISPDDGSAFKLAVQVHTKCFGLAGTVDKCTFADQSGKNGPDVEVAGGVETKLMKFSNKKSYKFYCYEGAPPSMRPPTSLGEKIARRIPIGM